MQPTIQVLSGDSRKVLVSPELTALRGKVRLVYADPPYNTHQLRGPFSDHRTSGDWQNLLGDVVAKSAALLRNDGSLWVHISDAQVGIARMVCDEILGRSNYCGTILWEHTRRPSFLHRQIASTLDFILVYAKDVSALPAFTWSQTQSGKRIPLTHRGNKLVEVYFPSNSVRFNCSDGVYMAGDHSTPGIDATLLDPVCVISGRNEAGFRIRIPSRFSPSRVMQLVDDGAEFLIPRVPFRPSYVSPGGEPKLIRNLWTWQTDPEIPTNEDSYKEQLEQHDVPFPYAKPLGLMRRILEVATEPGDMVVDPFGGSGTTAVAALETGRSCVIIEEKESSVSNFVVPRIQAAAWPSVAEGRASKTAAAALSVPEDASTARLASERK